MALTTGPITGAPQSPTKGTPPPGPDSNGTVGGGLTPAETDAYQAILSILRDAGLESLAPTVLKYVQQSYNSDTIMLLIQDTPEYKQRFAANEIRKSKGLPVLSPAEYLATERSYRQLMTTAGLPAGFYDSYDDFTNWLAGDVSPTEAQKRIDLARQRMYDKGPEWRDALRAYYPELTDDDLVAYELDSNRALPLLEKQWRTADIGVAANRAGLALSLDRANAIDEAGSGGNAAQGFQQVAQMDRSFGRLGDIYGTDYAQTDAENEVFGLTGSTDAAVKRRRLASQERASFGGSGGLSDKSLGSKAQ